jgi:hypothetical protein
MLKLVGLYFLHWVRLGYFRLPAGYSEQNNGLCEYTVSSPLDIFFYNRCHLSSAFERGNLN